MKRLLFVLSFIVIILWLMYPVDDKTSSKEKLSKTEIRWDWDLIEPININDFKFPKGFLWGVATSAHQVEGNCNCQWVDFERKHNLQSSGSACEHYSRYKEDIELMKYLGINAYRFSIEWSKVEPIQGYFNQDVIQHYHEVIDELLKNNILPVITLHHFTHPVWFENKGAFEKEENIKYFVRFCKKMFSEYSSKVSMWCTINEPGVYAFQGYLHGNFPPAKCDLQLMGIVSKNLILAHIEVFKALKTMKNGNRSKIGICHSITQFDPYHPGNKIEEFVTYYINHVFYDAMMQFFITGKFKFTAPKILQIILSNLDCSSPFSMLSCLKFNPDIDYSYENKEGKYVVTDILDFFGIQPYSHVLIDYTNTRADKNPSLRKGDILTDMPYCIYPESLYRAAIHASLIGVPIYITENGISDCTDNNRELYIRRYIYSMHKAIEDGCDIRGYFYWSLLDSFEWHMGYEQKFGLYEVDFNTQKRTLKNGAKIYRDIVQNYINQLHS